MPLLNNNNNDNNNKNKTKTKQIKEKKRKEKGKPNFIWPFLLNLLLKGKHRNPYVQGIKGSSKLSLSHRSGNFSLLLRCKYNRRPINGKLLHMHSLILLSIFPDFPRPYKRL